MRWWTVFLLLPVLVAGACDESAPALPAPATDGETSLEAALARRRSARQFTGRDLTSAEIGQLLWAAQGITSEGGYRTTPSAGALFPLEVHVATKAGLFHYVPRGHRLQVVKGEDLRARLSEAALSQSSVREAPAVFVISGVVARSRGKYRERATRYVHMEAGHAAQNLLLQATVLGLAGVPVGAFSDARVRDVLGLRADSTPLYLLPVGTPR